jgi:Amt family ammonium transporter
MKSIKLFRVLPLGLILGGAGMAFAQDAPAEAAASVSAEMLTVNNLWIMIAAFFVFMMHPGFALVESGLTRSKNTVNILFKNFAIVGIGLITYAICGFNLMYPGESWILGKFLGFAGFGIALPEGYDPLTYADGHYTYWTDFLFQAVFAATAATIVSGAVAERVKLSSFLIFSLIYVAVIYPIVGSWVWGKGWLADLGFKDFAGSTVVHSVGGWAALAGIIVLGPRKGKYVNGKSKPIPGHNLPLATLGVFLLWFGWFGFNGGSVLSADPDGVSKACVTTALGAAAGLFGAMMISWIIQKKPDLSMVLNGALAGLVGVTANADVISPLASIIIGGIAGILVVFAVLFFDGVLKLDDPVGATSVHLVCGVWGTLATGIFGVYDGKSFLVQLLGVGAAAVVCFVSAFILFTVIKAVLGLRVSPEEEMRGLDIGEHGMESYAGFQIFTSN